MMRRWSRSRQGGRPAPVFAALLRKVLTAAAALCAAAGCAVNPASGLSPAPYHPPVIHGTVASPALGEASGMAASIRMPGHFWMINDGGNGPMIHAVGPAGQNLGAVRVAGAANRDWEDLCAFLRGGEPYLLIADTGDNRAVEKAYALYLVKEPKMPGAEEAAPASVAPAKVIRFRFPEGPSDCEAVAVDPVKETVLLMTKRLRPPRLYDLDLAGADTAGTVTARPLGPVATIPTPSDLELMADPIFGRFRSQPTAMDISPDGHRAAVLTYGGGYLFEKAAGETWAEAFSREPKAFPAFDLRQAESICFGRDGRTVFISSEKRPAPLLRLDPMDDMRP